MKKTVLCLTIATIPHLLLLNPQIKIDSLHLKPVFIIYVILKYYDKKS